jgi:hypothetical protein
VAETESVYCAVRAWALNVTDYKKSLNVSSIRCLAQSFSFGEKAPQIYACTRTVLVTEVAEIARSSFPRFVLVLALSKEAL